MGDLQSALGSDEHPERITIDELAGGLRVVTIEMSASQTISAGFFIRGGGRCEGAEELGLSHFVEHMLFKGTCGYSAEEIGRIVEGGGGSLNAYTSEESTCLYVKTLPREWDVVMKVLLDMVVRATFDPVEIEREREVILEEIRSYEDLPGQQIEELFAETIWEGHPLGNPLLGTEESLRSHTREKLLAHYRRYYNASNMVLAVAGRITHSQVVEWATRFAAPAIPSGPRSLFLPFTHEVHTQLKVVKGRSEQVQLQFGFPCAGRSHRSEFALRLLSTLLGETMSSRLFQEIREKRALAYHVSSSFDLYEDVGCFSINSAVDPPKVAEFLNASFAILKEVTRSPFEPWEVAQGKRYLIGQALQEMEQTLNQMLWVGDKLIGDDENLSTHYFCEQVERVEARELTELASALFSKDRLHLALIGKGVSKRKALSHIRSW